MWVRVTPLCCPGAEDVGCQRRAHPRSGASAGMQENCRLGGAGGGLPRRRLKVSRSDPPPRVETPRRDPVRAASGEVSAPAEPRTCTSTAGRCVEPATAGRRTEAARICPVPPPSLVAKNTPSSSWYKRSRVRRRVAEGCASCRHLAWALARWTGWLRRCLADRPACRSRSGLSTRVPRAS